MCNPCSCVWWVSLRSTHPTKTYSLNRLMLPITTVNRQPSTVNRQPSTANRQPPTANRQPPTVNRQPSTD
ncbi:hypothetical protein QUF72_12485 [Desulfobacterales bacterium HSG2]|nr:hypothetical protein [Desulfobacterales bacterium HSG2]